MYGCRQCRTKSYRNDRGDVFGQLGSRIRARCTAKPKGEVVMKDKNYDSLEVARQIRAAGRPIYIA